MLENVLSYVAVSCQTTKKFNTLQKDLRKEFRIKDFM